MFSSKPLIGCGCTRMRCHLKLAPHDDSFSDDETDPPFLLPLFYFDVSRSCSSDDLEPRCQFSSQPGFVQHYPDKTAELISGLLVHMVKYNRSPYIRYLLNAWISAALSAPTSPPPRRSFLAIGRDFPLSC